LVASAVNPSSLKLMQSGIAAARILQTFPAGSELFHGIPSARIFHASW
jgi:hypothetical protein